VRRKAYRPNAAQVQEESLRMHKSDTGRGISKDYPRMINYRNWKIASMRLEVADLRRQLVEALAFTVAG